MTYDRRLIEDSLPLEVISEQSAREKSIRNGNISGLHVWWARRPLAAMRAAIFASLLPAPKDEQERDYLHQLIADIVNWDTSKQKNGGRIGEARKLIQKSYPNQSPTVLDPFMGGGSTGLEALRLGCETYGIELNPVAYIVQLCTLVYPQKYGKAVEVIPRIETGSELGQQDVIEPKKPKSSRQLELEIIENETVVVPNQLAEDVRYWGLWVLEKAKKEIGHLYNDPEGRLTLGYVWARTAKCPNPACGAEMPMVRQWWLARSKTRNVAIRMVIDKNIRQISFEIAEDDEIDFDPTVGTMRQGTIVCPVCGNVPAEDYLRQEGLQGNLGSILMAVMYDRPNQNGKGYRCATFFDEKLFKEAQEQLKIMLNDYPDWFLYEEISAIRPSPNARGLSGLTRYGIDQFADLYNERQMLSLLTFLKILHEAIKLIEQETDQDYARAIATYLALMLDRLADFNSNVCVLNNVGGRGVVHAFGRQALPMVWDYAETNPFNPYGANWLGAIETIYETLRAIEGIEIPANLRQGSATRLKFEDGTFDAVITDPPYYDSVPYADLSDFFYVWLKRSLGNIYPELFTTPLTPKLPEITEHARHGENAREYYEQQMTLAFSEAQRVMKDDGIAVVVFAHKSTSAWETLINSLLRARLVVSASWPLHTERPGRLTAQNTGALASSIFIVCRKRTAQEDGHFDDVRRELRERVTERLDFFWSQGIRGADFFISAIGPAVEVFGRHSRVRKLSGEEVGVAELLDLVQEAVADYALGKVLNGRYKMGTVDSPTRFYVMYRWSYADEKLPFDDGRRLAQALGAEVNDLIHRYGIVKQSGDSITVPGPNGRKNDEHLGESGRDGTAAPVIDVLHRATLVWQKGDRRALAEYLAAHALGREEEVNAVAQALVNVLPQGDRERQLLENYLQGSSDLPDVPRTQRLEGF